MPQESGLPFELGIIRNHYVGRTFIEPTDQIRHLGVRLKHNASRANLEGQAGDPRRRFDRARHDLDQDRRDGAARRRPRSPYAHLEPADDAIPCFYGIATPERDELLAARFDVEEMAKLIGVDSLAFVSIDGLYRAMGEPRRDRLAPRFCDACFTGDYPIPPTDADNGKVSVQLSLLAAPA